MSARCTWSQDGEESCWGTTCGHYFMLNDGGPKDNGMKFCCYCGRELDEVPYAEDNET